MELAPMLKALGDPTRLRLFQALLERKHCVRSLSRTLGISEPAVSQHLKLMRDCGLVCASRHGRHIHHMPAPEAAAFLAHCFAEMAARSAALDRSDTPCQCLYRKEDTL